MQQKKCEYDFYNSLLAKWFLGKGKKHYFMLGWFFFTRYKYLGSLGKIWNSEFMPDSIGNVFL